MPIIAPQYGSAKSVVPSVRTYSELNRHVVATGMDAPYRIWLLARAIDTDGRGIVGADALVAALAEAGLNRRHLTRALRHPQASIFVTARKWSHALEYRSLEAVCLALAVVPGRCIDISTGALATTEDFRAHLYAAWIAAHDNLHISREKLTDRFNASADTLRRWECLTGVEVTYNIVEVDPDTLESAQQHIPRDARLVPDREDRAYMWEYKGKTYYRTVNRYRSNLERDRVGKCRKIARKVRALLPGDNHGAGTVRRVFFSERTMPAGRQETPGASLRDGQCVVTTSRGESRLWRFNRMRPGKRKDVLR